MCVITIGSSKNTGQQVSVESNTRTSLERTTRTSTGDLSCHCTVWLYGHCARNETLITRGQFLDDAVCISHTNNLRLQVLATNQTGQDVINFASSSRQDDIAFVRQIVKYSCIITSRKCCNKIDLHSLSKSLCKF